MLRGKAPHWLAWGADAAPASSLALVAHHAVDFWLSSEDLPHPDNRVSIDREGAVHLSLVETNPEGLKRLRRKFQSMLGDLGMHEGLHERKLYLHEAMDISATAHQAGTARFGTDAATSVLDPTCKAHELDNLYVVDSSFFASIGAVNPTLTIIANALRVGDHLLERLGRPGPRTKEEVRHDASGQGGRRTSRRSSGPRHRGGLTSCTRRCSP
jgi:choline dehydrogenase-like flavoprotein